MTTLQSGHYGVIYADSPWRYGAGFKKTGGVHHHYPTLSWRDLEALPVWKLAAPDCALCMWAVLPQLPRCIKVMEAWGFAWSTVLFVWVKTNRSGLGWHSGLGRHTNANAEVVLLGKRGRPSRLANDVKQLIFAPVGKHSAKPLETYDRIEALYRGPFVELFARHQRRGWDATGLDLDGQDIRTVLRSLASPTTGLSAAS